MCTVNTMDSTAAQALIDVRNQLARYAAPETVDWRFANIQSRWTKRALASSGFGYRDPQTIAAGGAESIFSIADLGDPDIARETVTSEEDDKEKKVLQHDIEQGKIEEPSLDVQKSPSSGRRAAVHGLNRPYFHVDLQEAVEAAIESLERQAKGSEVS